MAKLTKFSCFADFDTKAITYADCVLDYGATSECPQASSFGTRRKHDCPFWRQYADLSPTEEDHG